ncbi:MAG TPA: hypothetical protein VNJ08_16745 [Bacteriovoracaceae bacterium]|nr:hypothetical protein [Bacteriovoracaceae bacterium]
MKLFLLFIFSIFSFSTFAITRPEIESLLKEKNVSLNRMEQKGAKVLFGEVTGHSPMLPFAKIQVLLTKDEAILKKDFDSVDFRGAQDWAHFVAVHSLGQLVLKQDIHAVIVLGQ